MTTEDFIIHIFYLVDNRLSKIEKHTLSKLYPSDVVTIGILFALKGGHFRAFYRWLKRDYDGLDCQLRTAQTQSFAAFGFRTPDNFVDQF